MDNECQFCSIKFTSVRKSNFCSPNCRGKYRYSIKKDQILEEQKKYKKSKKIKTRIKRNGTHKLLSFTKKCTECTSSFTTKQYNKLTCSVECKKIRNAKLKKDKILNDNLYAMKIRIRTLISSVFYYQGYTKKSKCLNIIGLNYNNFYLHLKSSFEQEYGIPLNYINLSELEIDHITPISSARNEKEILKLNNYKNLRLIFKEDNRKKSNKRIY